MSDMLADAEIVRGLRQGERQAWQALCAQFGRRLWKYVARFVGHDENVAADVYQETLLAAAKSGRTIREDTPLWPWLAAIAHNQAALYWRKTYQARRVGSNVDFSEAALEHDPAQHLLQTETVEMVRCLLAEMSANSAALLIGKYLDGMSIAELVDSTGGTTEGVRSQLARARREFRGRYERATLFSHREKNAIVQDQTLGEGDKA